MEPGKRRANLNMPEALAVVWDLVKSNLPEGAKRASLLRMDGVLGLDLAQKSKIPQEVQELVKEREKLRKEEKWEEADRIRVKIEKMGYKVEDTDSEAKLSKIAMGY